MNYLRNLIFSIFLFLPLSVYALEVEYVEMNPFTGNLDATVTEATLDTIYLRQDSVSAADIPIALGTGSPTVDQLQEYFDNTGSSGFFTGGVLSDGGSGTLDVAAGEGFIRTTNDDNAPLLSFKWSASAGIAVPDNTTQYVYVDDAGTISLSTDEFLEKPDKIQIGVVTDEAGSTIHIFQLGVRLEESIGAAGRFIRRVHGISRNNRLGGLIFGQSGDANRDVTMTAGRLEWGRTTYIITSFNTSGADTFSTYSAGGQEAAAASQWDNDNFDNGGSLLSLGNNKWANLFFFIEPDEHIVMIYGRSQFNSQAIAENEGVPSSSLPSKVSETGILAARFTFKKGDDTAVISSAFEALFANAGVTDHGNLAGLADDDHTQYILDAGDIYTGVHDAGGATSFEIPNTAGDVALSVLGQIAVDTAQKQLVVYDGIEKAIPLRHIIQGQLGTGDFDSDADVFILSLDSTTYPDGIVLTGWDVSCSEADPTTELAANLNFADDRGTGAFPGASATLIDVITTTTGNSSENDMSNSDKGDGIILTGKEIYITITADPVSDTTLFRVLIKFYIPES